MSDAKNNQKLPDNTFLWLIGVSFFLSAVVCLGALRSNNQKMIELRNGVYAADKRGEGIEEALGELRGHVYSHMNTSLSSTNNGIKPPIQLKYTYERLLAAEQEKAAQSGNSLYTDAQNYCQAQNSIEFSGRSRIPCIEEYVASRTAVVPSNIPVSLYQFDFISPSWSSDLAGWSLVSAALFGMALAGTVLVRFLATKKINK